jgi:DNA (cytosine-5)-methyltransferase 1
VVHLVRQDLSIAGKRKGLAGERSGLFMEQIRIIKEMREHDRKTGRTGEFVRPRYMVWENVAGTFSSNKGRDFAAVLEEAIRVAEPEAPDIQVPDKGWPTWGGYRDVDGRWSVAWRVLDAQWWGVPQRRRRIALVADFGGTTAHEILFNTKGVYGHPETGREAGERPSRGTESGTHESGEWARCLTPYDTQTNRVYGADGIWPTLPAQENSGQNRQSVFCVPINDKATRFSGGGDTRKDDGAGNGLGVGHDGEPSPTLTAADRHGVYCAGFKLGNSENARSIGYQEEQSPTLNAECGGNKPAVVYSLDSFASNSMKSPNPKSGCREVDTARTLDTTSPDPSKNQGGIAILDMSHANDVIRECGDVVPTLQSRMETVGNQVPLTYAWERSDSFAESDISCTQSARQGKSATDLSVQHGIVRRLTPMECERLQNFPDGWTDIGAWTDEKGKLHKESSDSARYRALGNSIALPPWKWVLKQLCAQYERDATLGSLFDGLGGFPLIWMQLNGWKSVKWASEIEPFCIAVTKRHFGDEKNPGDAWKYLIGAQKDG